jgi:hypothetical protein
MCDGESGTVAPVCWLGPSVRCALVESRTVVPVCVKGRRVCCVAWRAGLWRLCVSKGHSV